VNDHGHAASPEMRAVMKRFWQRIIVMLILQTIAIVALVKLLP
jgi:hypothetical protein